MSFSIPQPVDITDFSFRQLRKLKISEPNYLNVESSNLLAASTRFGLVFAGCQNGFKVIRLETILELDNLQNKTKEDATDFPCQIVPLSSNPCAMALSCDSLTLAVCIIKDYVPFVQLFDVRAFSTQNVIPAPFNEIRLSSTAETKVRDLTWNPVVAEMFAVCTSDGALGVYEVSGTVFKIMASLPFQSASTALCWSPKGKQLVVGKMDGRLVQYKPTLQETKIIPPPNIFENMMTVVSVYWLSTTQFAAVYATASGEDRTPNLVITNLPKAEPPSYLNYGDVCFGSGEKKPRYFMVHQAEWHILLCTSSSALETVILGSHEAKQPVWEQWNLDDRGRAELPLLNHEETSALGMTVISCAQRKIIVSDNEVYPPMPVLLLLSSSGILCPFHMLNLRQNVPNLVSLLEAIPTEGERKGILTAPLQAPFVASTPILPPVSIDKQPSMITPKVNLLPKFCEAGQKPAPSLFSTTESIFSGSGKPIESYSLGGDSPFRPQPTLFSSSGTAGIFSQSNSGDSMFQPQSSLFTAPSIGILSQSSSNVATTMPSPGPLVQQPQGPAVAPKVVASQSVLPKPRPQQMVAPISAPLAKQSSAARMGSDGSPGPPTRPILVPVAHSKAAVAPKIEEKKPVGIDTFALTMLDEMTEFEKEVNDLKVSVSRNCFTVGSKEEMGHLRKVTEIVQEFARDIKETMQSLSSDVHMLKSSLLESFALLEEAKSREARDRDPHYISLMRSHPLDPISTRRLREIRRLYQYLDFQFREVNNRLDQDWKEYSQLKKRNAKLKNRFPSMQVLYRTLLNNHNLLGSLHEQLDRLTAQAKDLKLRGTPGRRFLLERPSLRSEKDDLSTLADTLLETRLSPKEPSTDQTPVSKLTPVKEASLREFLSQRQIRTVKAKQLESLSESRIVSIFRLSQNEQKQPHRLVPSVKSPNLESSSQAPTPVVTSIKPVVSIASSSLPVSSSLTSPSSVVAADEAHCTSKAMLTSLSDQRLENKTGLKSIFQPSTAGVPPPNVSLLSKPVPMSSTPTTGSAPSKGFSFGGSAQSQNSSMSPFSFTFGPKMPAASGGFPFSVSQDTSSAKKPSSDGAIKSATPVFVTTPQTVKLQLSEMAKPPSAKYSFQGSSTSAFASPQLTIPKALVSSTPNVAIDQEQVEILPKYDNITPPDSPQPILAYEEDNLTEITEETKVIEIDVGGSLSQPVSSPTVKVSSVGSPIVSKAPAGFSAFSLSPATTKQPSLSLSAKIDEPSAFLPSSTSNDGVPLPHDSTSKQSSASPLPSFTFAGTSLSKSTKSPPSVPVPTVGFSFSGTLAQSKESSSEKPITVTPISESKITTTEPISTEEIKLAVNVTPVNLLVSSETSNAQSVPLSPPFSSTSTLTVTTTSSEEKILTSEQAVASAPSILGQPPPVVVVTATSTVPTIAQPQPVNTTFGQVSSPEVSLTSTITTSAFGQSTPTSVTVSVSPVISTPVFGQTAIAPSSAPSIFGGAPTATVSSASQTFGAVASIFGGQSTPASTTPAPAFGQVTSPSTAVSSFGQAAIPPTSPASGFGQASTVPTSAPPAFGQASVAPTSATPGFGQASTVPTSVSLSFGQVSITPTSATPSFGQATPTTTAPLFGSSQPGFGLLVSSSQPTFGSSGASAVFAQASTLFGKQETSTAPPLFGSTAPLFGQATSFGQPPVSGASIFGQSPPSFGQPATSGSIFGGQQATTTAGSVFGQSAPSPSTGFSFSQQTSVFGQNQSSTFGQQPGSTFGNQQGAATNVFGQTSTFFGGLGAKPNPENATKNVFGSASSFGSSQTQGTSMFGNQGASTFGNNFGSFSGGSFSSGTGTSVAQSGFGAFQQSPQKAGSLDSGGFGAAPVFGSTFGGSQSFGSSPTFGGNVPTFGSTFGGSTAPGFGTFGTTTPTSTFGSLVNQNQTPTFGNLSTQPPGGFGALGQQQNQQGGFGSPPAFGSGTAFGQGTFGSQSSAFSQWRQ